MLRPAGICRTLTVLDPPPLAEEGDHAQPSLLGQRGGGGPMRAPRSTFDRARTLRREMTLPEVLLWQALRRRQLDGLLFRRQHPVGPYVLDFYCPAHGLAIEVDGAAHDGADRAARDRRRDAWLGAQGIRVVRFPAVDILRETSRLDVLATIAAAAASSTALSCGPPPPRCGGG